MESTSKTSFVPFPRFFAIVGYVIVSFIVLCLLIEGCAWVLVHVHSAMTERPAGEKWDVVRGHCRGLGNGNCSRDLTDLDMASANPEYGKYEWSEAYWAEERKRAQWWWDSIPYYPFAIWGNHALAGQYLNVDQTPNGAWRRTVNAQCAGPKKVVWFFGGSVGFGYGSPDDQSVASLLSKRLAADGICTTVVNMAVEGYVSTQELIVLEQHLRLGERPDMVVFLDGYNDADSGAAQSTVATGHLKIAVVKDSFEQRHDNMVRRWFAASNTARLLRGILSRLPGNKGNSIQSVDEQGRVVAQDLDKDPDPSSVSRVIDVYATNRRIVKDIGEAYGFKSYFFWQPTLWASKIQTTSPYTKFLGEEDSAIGLSRFSKKAIANVYSEAEKRADREGFQYLGGIFDGRPEPLFIDCVHVTPQGNALMADAIAEVVAEKK